MAKVIKFPEHRHDYKPLKIDLDASLPDIAALLNEAIYYSDNGDTDNLRECLFTIHAIIYPDSVLKPQTV